MESSTLGVQLEASLADVERSVQKAIDPSYSTGEHCEGDVSNAVCATAFLEPELPLVGMSADRLTAREMIRFRVQGVAGIPILAAWVPFSCGDHDPVDPTQRMEVSFSAALRWSSAWTLEGFDPAASAHDRDRCLVTVKDKDVTGDIEGLLNNNLKPLAEAKLPELSKPQLKFHDKLQAGWDSLHVPLPIGSDWWLEIRPDSVRAGPIGGQGDKVSTSLALFARPRLHLGKAPTSTPTTNPLPDLRVGTSPDSMFASFEVQFPFTELKKKLDGLLIGQTRTKKIPLLPDLSVRVTGTTVFPSGDDVVVGVSIDGSVKGTLYLLAHFEYDCYRHLATISAIDYDVDTQNALIRLARWLAPAFLDQQMRALFRSATFDAGPALDKLDDNLKSSLNRPLGGDVTLASVLHPTEAIGHYNTDSSLVVVAGLTGHMSVLVAPQQQMPHGDEVKAISVLLTTLDDNKDDDEPVTITLTRDNKNVGNPREFWRDREIEDGQAAGPYLFPYRTGAKRGECGRDVFWLFKEPHGSDTGSQWNVSLSVIAYYTDGTEREVIHQDRLKMGDGNDYNRHFDMCW